MRTGPSNKPSGAVSSAAVAPSTYTEDGPHAGQSLGILLRLEGAPEGLRSLADRVGGWPGPDHLTTILPHMPEQWPSTILEWIWQRNRYVPAVGNGCVTDEPSGSLWKKCHR